MENPTSFNLKEIIPALSLIIDHQAGGNLYHGLRVAIISYHLSQRQGLKDLDLIFYAGLLHDIGLFETGEHLALNYKDIETQKATPALLNHPALSAAIVKEIPGMEQAAESILEHHEFFDGSGYPLGKKNAEISVVGQILRIADSFDIFLRKNPVKGIDVVSFVMSGRRKEFSSQLSLALLRCDRDLLSKITGQENIKRYFTQLSANISSPQVAIAKEEGDILLSIFSRAIDGKHRYTKEHSQRVSVYAFKIGERLGLGQRDLERIKAAGYLHDIGKIAIPNSILDKPGPLTEEEWEVIKTHPTVSHEIVSSVAYFKDIYDIVFADQENYDGTGYPKGLKDDEIPLGARIILVADAIDAMLSDRSYRKALPRKEAILELKLNSGKQFDPKVVEAAVNLLKEGMVVS